MKRILFVDDETRLLEALKRRLRPLHDECDLRFVTSGLEALQMLDREPFDMLITDIRMPGMDGSELLAAVREQHPEVTRIILSGTTDLDPPFKLRSQPISICPSPATARRCGPPSGALWHNAISLRRHCSALYRRSPRCRACPCCTCN